MVGAYHERVSRGLACEIRDKIVSLPGHTKRSVELYGSTRFHHLVGAPGKEGDESLAPRTRVGSEQWPSLVVEIGYSESEKKLRRDARWWLTNSGGQTRFVITVKVRKNPLRLTMNCLKMAPPRYNLRNTPPTVPTHDQSFDIDAAGNVLSEPGSTGLRIPYGCIFDQVAGDPPDIVFSFEELREFALDRFALL